MGNLRDTMAAELKEAEDTLRAQLGQPTPGNAEAATADPAAAGAETAEPGLPAVAAAEAPSTEEGERPESLVAPDAAREADPAYWRHRAETIRGQLAAANRKHAEELAAVRDELALARQAFGQQSELIEMLKSRGAAAEPGTERREAPRGQPAAPGKVKPTEITRQQLIEEEGYTEQEIEDYGEEWLKGQAARRRTQEAQMDRRVSEQVQRLTAQQSEQNDAARRWDEIERLCPGAKKAEAEAGRNGLAEWLSEAVVSADGLPTGVTRRQLAQQAFAEGRADLVARLFGTFLKKPAGAAGPSVQSQVAPRGRPEPMTAAAQGPGRPKVWTIPEIEQFSEDCLRGKYRLDQRVAIQRDIDNAAREGRIAQ